MKIASKMPEPQLMTTRLMIRLNSIRIFSKVGNLGQGVYIRFGKSGGGVYFKQKKRQHSFEVASIIIIVSLIQLFLQFLILFNYLVNLIFTPT